MLFEKLEELKRWNFIILPAKLKWWEIILDPVETYHYQIILKLQIFTLKYIIKAVYDFIYKNKNKISTQTYLTLGSLESKC